MSQFFKRFRSEWIFWLPALLASVCFHSGKDWFFAQKLGLLLFFSLVTANWLSKRYGFFVSGFMAYCLGSGFYAAMWRVNKYAFMQSWQRTDIARSVFYGIIVSLLSLLTIQTLKKETLERLLIGLALLIVAFFWFLRGLVPDGPVMTYSLAGIVLVFVIPIALKKYKWSLWFIIPTLITSHGKTAFASLLAMLWGYLFLHRMRLAFCLLLYPLIPLAYLWASHWHPTPWFAYWRLDEWKMASEWFSKQDCLWFGTGSGTWASLAPWIETEHKVLEMHGGSFVYLHNEFLQAYIEIGIIGLVWLCLIWIRTFIRCMYAGNRDGIAFLCSMVPAACFLPLRHDILWFMVLVCLDPLLKRRNFDIVNK